MKTMLLTTCIALFLTTGCTSRCTVQSETDAQIYTTLNEIHQDLIRLNQSVNKSNKQVTNISDIKKTLNHSKTVRHNQKPL
ncbi:hypothetical protein KB976_004392 [Vibrio parahaemolyticus]|nr:hypothetical protein [Vibrio parahaemolyticus]